MGWTAHRSEPFHLLAYRNIDALRPCFVTDSEGVEVLDLSLEGFFTKEKTQDPWGKRILQWAPVGPSRALAAGWLAGTADRAIRLCREGSATRRTIWS